MDNKSEKYILLTEVTERCSGLAKKWNCIRDKKKAENSLEDELINRALRQQLYLYCFMPITRISGKRWCFIWSDYLKGFLNPHATIDCNLLLVNSIDRVRFDLLVDSHPRLMEVKRSDLYLSLEELKKFEENEEDFADLVIAESNLAIEEEKFKPVSIAGNPNILKLPDSTKETSSMPLIGEPVDFQPSKDASEPVFPSTPGSEIVTTVDTQRSPVSGIDQESPLITQTEKPKRTKQPNKKKEKTFTRNIDSCVETAGPNPLGKDDREPLPFKTFADLQTRTLSLDEIIGNREKGIPAIIPVSKSTWYAGVKSGRYPKSFEVSEGRVAWRGSDIYALLQQMGMV
jgi:predicted DNA-binding transcriptional regulator AlpA